MKYKFLQFYIVIICFLAFGSWVQAAPNITFKAKLDSVNLLMGQVTTLHLSITKPSNISGEAPLLKRLSSDGIIGLCGDSIELSLPIKGDTVKKGNLETFNYDITLQSFDSGYYQLPPFVYIAGKDTFVSNSLGLKVYPVRAEADTPINQYASYADPENPSIFDWIPDFIIDLWWLWLTLICIVIIVIIILSSYRSKGYIIPKRPGPPPYAIALKRLRELNGKKLWENGFEKAYYTELTEILRIYLKKQFGINAMEMTSRQILDSLMKNEGLKDKRHYFRQILNMADFVKFAKVRPLPDDNVLAYNNAVKFIEETKPKPVEDIPNQQPNNGKKIRLDEIPVDKDKKGGAG